MNIYGEMKCLAEKQFALDYNCCVEDFRNRDTLVTIPRIQEGMRKYEDPKSFLSILSYNGKLIISADEAIQIWCKDTLAKQMSAQWGFDLERLISIDKKLHEYGYKIDRARIFLIPKDVSVEQKDDVLILSREDITVLKGDKRIDEAFVDADYIDNVIGTAIRDSEGKLCAVAGATNNGKYMWELGVNSFVEGRGYATAVIHELIRQVIKQDKVPFYHTAMSHLSSMNVALRAGMIPTFCELRAVKANI